MTKYTFLFFLAMSMLVLSTACNSSKKDNTGQDEISTILPDSKNEVTVFTVKRQSFNHELVSNGKVSARTVADLRFQSAEVISHIWVKNGDRVRKGQKLAELDKFRLANKVTQMKDAVERAKLDLQDVLIGQGYNLDDLDKVPADIMQLAKIKSGSEQNQSQYELALYELQHATLVAPFDGVVANLFAKPYNIASLSDAFCTVVDIRGMEVDFTVLENELALIKTGDKVRVSPYSDIVSSYNGNICEINPMVDDKGMVNVKARIDGDNKLFTGMNVHVSVHRSLEKQLVIPKSAVVLRSGKQVVFTLEDGKAYWNYIHTGLENADHYTLIEDAKEGLKEGDTVIVTGNINLAHEAPVTVIDNEN
ncbi:MAG: efflux RND transporter periplasmic adaptor subunit [Mediterranea sp.]|nr:efflux RND transporter periplasmic adaptor subunit [Mediterranea sp.]